jgi:L,D-transpeptidase catalytic domain
MVHRAILRIECHERFPPPSRKSFLMNSSKHLLFNFVVASGLVLWLASATPVGAGWFGFPDQPHYSNWRQSQSLKPHRKSRREISSRKQEAQPEQPRPQGPFQIIVAIAGQQASIYGQDGFITRAPISTGMPAHPTPTGIFTFIAKARWHASNIYSGAPMPYMERITWSGIALHAGPRPGYPASHGCIRLPQDFAIRLFQMTKIGTRVIVTRDAVAPIEITHPKLFVPKKPTEQTAALATDMIKGAIGIAADTPAPEHPSAASGFTSDGNTTPIESKRAVGLSRPVSVFVSRKQGRVFVRRGFTELFDLPIKIDEPDRPIGTHIFTAMGFKDDGKTMRWTVVSVPSQYRHHVSRSGKGHVGGQTMDHEQVVAMPSTAAEALERIEWPPEAIDQISSLLITGSSLIVSDNALSDETDADTDFIVLTP